MKKILSFLMMFFLCFTCFAASDEMSQEDVINHYQNVKNQNIISFNDIESFPWAKEPIKELAARDIVKGVGNGMFMPQNTVSRYEYIKMITSVCGLVNPMAKTNHTDIEKSHWAYMYVASAYELGLIDIYSDVIFNGMAPITREEIAYISAMAMLKNDCIEKLSDNAADFNDTNQMSNYSLSPIATLNELGVINGRDNGSFSPKDYATRAESAKIIYNILKIIESNF